jgi:hypothetical protein
MQAKYLTEENIVKELKQMKIACLLSPIKYSLLALFLLLVFFPLSASAASLNIGSASGEIGDIVEVRVTIGDASGTLGGEFELYFMPDQQAGTQRLVVESVSPGSFLDTSALSFYNRDWVDGMITFSWSTPDGDTATGGDLAIIRFELVDVGNSDLLFSGNTYIEVSQFGPVSFSSLQGGSIYSSPPTVDNQTAMAIQEAIDAIAALPPVPGLTLKDKPAVENARSLANRAINNFGAKPADIHNLNDKLVPAEQRIRELESAGQSSSAGGSSSSSQSGSSQSDQKKRGVSEAEALIAKLPPTSQITLEDKGDVERAREAVEKAISEHGAAEDDFENLAYLKLAEGRIRELEAQKGEVTSEEALNEAILAIAVLPLPDEIALEDEEQVKYARYLVEKAKNEYGLAEEDITNLGVLIAAEERIRELTEDAAGKKDWFTAQNMIIAALILVIAVTLFLIARVLIKRRAEQ